MDFKDLGPIVGSSAPLIGKLISVGVSFIPGIGPIAGSILGPAIGAIIAKKFGVANDPAAIAGAITAAGGPESEIVKAKLAAATEEVKAQYAWATAVETGQLKLEEVQVSQVNETMRAELPVESPFKTWWRPTNGWVLAYGTAGTMTMMFMSLILAMRGNVDPINIMISAWPLILAVLSVPAAVVGVVGWKRSDEKIATLDAVTSGKAVIVPADTKSQPVSPPLPTPPKIMITPPPPPAGGGRPAPVRPHERPDTGGPG